MKANAPVKNANLYPRVPTLLIVDDSPATLRGLKSLFASGGYEPAIFQEGLAAIGYARECLPAAAIIDIHLPDISGLVLSRELRGILGPDAPIVVLSGDASMEVLNSLTHVGATYFFQKPVNGLLLLTHFYDQLNASFPGISNPTSNIA